jgi:hypothetical protein
MYGPGSPFKALKQRQVSSQMTGKLFPKAFSIASEANLHFSAEISSGSPCNSGTFVMLKFFKFTINFVTNNVKFCAQNSLNFREFVFISSHKNNGRFTHESF